MAVSNNTIVNSSLGAVESTIERINPTLNNIFIALIILLISFIIGRLVGSFAVWFLKRLNIDRHSSTLFGTKIEPSKTIAKLASIIIYIIGIFLSLNHLGLASITANILIGIAVAAIILSFFISIIEALPNLFAGFRIRKHARLKENSTIVVGNIAGRIKDLGLLEATLETKDKEIIVMPYSVLERRITINTTFTKKTGK